MNKKQLKSKKSNTLFFIGSARGVNRFYITNKFIEKFPSAKAINTGALINKLARDMDFENVDKVSVEDYYRYLEPAFIENIINHLEHGDVILDTHFHYLIPCISSKGLKKFIGKLANVVVVLVSENPEQIYDQKKEGDDKWFGSLENIESDFFSNEIYFEFYQDFFPKTLKKYSLSVNLDNEEDIERVDNFLDKLNLK